MPYVKRNAQGVIVALLAEQTPDAGEFLPSNHVEVMAFLYMNRESAAFGALDADFIRVTEDLIQALIEKGVIQFTDLPRDAQRKLMERQSFRERRIDGALNILGTTDDSNKGKQ